MRYHVPASNPVTVDNPRFMLHNGELILPQKEYTQKQYPSLPFDMVKITGMNGKSHFVSKSKLRNISSMDI